MRGRPGDLSMSMRVDLSNPSGWQAHDNLNSGGAASRRSGRSVSDRGRQRPWVMDGARRTLKELGL